MAKMILPGKTMTQDECTETLGELLAPLARRVEADLERHLVEPGTPDALAEAMRYCVLGGGKRLRPSLVYLAAEAVGDGQCGELLARSAVAVELVHCYSLVHDDLPAMDNDLLRRGRPTAHVKFGEAMAILAGDALLTRATGILAGCEEPGAARLVAELARAAGPAGMIAGQVADMDLCHVEEGIDGLRYIHRHKTGALIRAAARMGALCAHATDEVLEAIASYAERLGLAFQLIDDMLDVTGDTASLGKTAGKDATSDKRTHVDLLGLQRTAALGRELTREASRALAPLGESARTLCRLAELLVQRRH